LLFELMLMWAVPVTGSHS